MVTVVSSAYEPSAYVGESPHAKENVIVYLPHEKILFQGDLFYYSGLAQFPAKDPSRDRVMKFFGDWLVKNKLEPAQIMASTTADLQR